MLFTCFISLHLHHPFEIVLIRLYFVGEEHRLRVERDLPRVIQLVKDKVGLSSRQVAPGYV